jgi:hypothetical protein
MSSTSSTTSSIASSAVNNNDSCDAERFLLEQSNRLSVLYALCIGLEETSDDGTTIPLLDLNEGPFKLLKRKEIKPSLDVLRDEVTRRSELDSTRTNFPKPKGWHATKCHDWLKENPITTDNDIAFLFKKAKEVKQVVANDTQKTPTASNNQPSGDAEQGIRWFGPLPYLRLIHCLMEDDVKDKWIHRNDPKTIQDIDARNSDVREENVFEIIANRWNSDSFNPTTMVSSRHVDFSSAIDIGIQATSEFSRASPTKVKDKLAKMKCDLTKIINNWERSGQGEGGRLDEVDDDEEDSGIGKEVTSNEVKYEWGRTRSGAFDCRESFLGSYPSYLLYFWDVLENNNLFKTTMNRLSDDAGASSANDVPSVIRTKATSSMSQGNNDISVFVSSFREVIVEASKNASMAEDKRMDMKAKAAEKRVILQAQLDNKSYLKRRIDTLQDEARKIRFKIFELNESEGTKEESFFNSELEMIEKEISKCNNELENN